MDLQCMWSAANVEIWACQVLDYQRGIDVRSNNYDHNLLDSELVPGIRHGLTRVLPLGSSPGEVVPGCKSYQRFPALLVRSCQGMK